MNRIPFWFKNHIKWGLTIVVIGLVFLSFISWGRGSPRTGFKETYAPMFAALGENVINGSKDFYELIRRYGPVGVAVAVSPKEEWPKRDKTMQNLNGALRHTRGTFPNMVNFALQMSPYFMLCGFISAIVLMRRKPK